MFKRSKKSLASSPETPLSFDPAKQDTRRSEVMKGYEKQEARRMAEPYDRGAGGRRDDNILAARGGKRQELKESILSDAGWNSDVWKQEMAKDPAAFERYKEKYLKKNDWDISKLVGMTDDLAARGTATRRRMGVLRDQYFYQMLDNLATPLSKGGGALDVVMAAAMMDRLRKGSPEFRRFSSRLGRDVLNPVIRSRLIPERKGLDNMTDRELEKAARARKFKDRLEYEAAGGRYELIPESVGMIQISIAKETYARILEHPENRQRILDLYDRAEKNLYEMARIDGISKVQVARILPGMLESMAVDPNVDKGLTADPAVFMLFDIGVDPRVCWDVHGQSLARVTKDGDYKAVKDFSFRPPTSLADAKLRLEDLIESRHFDYTHNEDKPQRATAEFTAELFHLTDVMDHAMDNEKWPSFEGRSREFAKFDNYTDDKKKKAFLQNVSDDFRRQKLYRSIADIRRFGTGRDWIELTDIVHSQIKAEMYDLGLLQGDTKQIMDMDLDELKSIWAENRERFVNQGYRIPPMSHPGSFGRYELEQESRQRQKRQGDRESGRDDGEAAVIREMMDEETALREQGTLINGMPEGEDPDLPEPPVGYGEEPDYGDLGYYESDWDPGPEPEGYSEYFTRGDPALQGVDMSREVPGVEVQAPVSFGPDGNRLRPADMMTDPEDMMPEMQDVNDRVSAGRPAGQKDPLPTEKEIHQMMDQDLERLAKKEEMAGKTDAIDKVIDAVGEKVKEKREKKTADADKPKTEETVKKKVVRKPFELKDDAGEKEQDGPDMPI